MFMPSCVMCYVVSYYDIVMCQPIMVRYRMNCISSYTSGANRTWSGERPTGMKDLSRRSHDSFTVGKSSRNQAAPYKSYDALMSKNTAGWKFEANSDDDSAVM